jgi:LacI family transcriptional regulator
VLPNVPIVESCRFYPSDLPFVGDDVSEVCRKSMSFLIAHGHRRISALCGPWIDTEAFARFAQGFRRAFEDAGLPCPRSLLCHAIPGEPLDVLAREVIAGPGRPTAVFAENWRVCRATLKALDALRLRVPDDVSVLGYGQNVRQMASPIAITAYVPDSRGIGDRAVKLLIEIVSGRAVPADPTPVAGQLVEGRSVGRVAVAGSPEHSA